MLEISGYVLIRETGAGVANLVVAAFDSGRAPDSLHNQAPIAEVLQRLGTRISSVLTDADGRFVLTSDELTFQGNEMRPDLVIAVFAPEDVVERERPYPAPPHERVLYLSLLPRVDAGAREAFLIRLAHGVVEPYLISAEAGAVRTGFERTWAARDATTETLNARHVQELERRDKAKKQAAKHVAGLNAVPVSLRDHKFLVTNKADLVRYVKRNGTKMTALESLQNDAMLTSLQNFKKKNRSSTSRLILTEEDLKELGLAIKNGQVSPQKTTLEKLNAVSLRLNGGTDLVLKKADGTMGLAQADLLEAKYLKAEAAQLATRVPSRPKQSARPRKNPKGK
jgi:hypothetical protein